MTSAAKKKSGTKPDIEQGRTNPLPSGCHPLLAALERAPIGEPFTSEQRAELDQQMEDIRAGRTKLVRHEDRAAWLEAHARELGDPDE